MYIIILDIQIILMLNNISDNYSLQSIISIKSYTYLKLIFGYGPDKGATVTIFWSAETKSFRMIFGTNSTAINAHSIMREQFEAHLNRYRDLTQVLRKNIHNLILIMYKCKI